MLFAFASTTPRLAAQEGTWHFSGKTCTTTTAFGGDTGTMMKSQITITRSGDSYTASYAWDSSQTDTFTLAADPKAPAGVFASVLKHSSIVNGVETQAKFVKIDNDTWLFYFTKSTPSSTSSSYSKPARVVGGVLTRSAPPAVNASAWAGGGKAVSNIGIDFYPSSGFEERIGGSTQAVWRIFKNGSKYYLDPTLFTLGSGWNFDYFYNTSGELTGYSVENSSGEYFYNADGTPTGQYYRYDGNTSYEYYENQLRASKRQDGNVFYYYDSAGRLEWRREYRSGEWYCYDADGDLEEIVAAGYYLQEGDFLDGYQGDYDERLGSHLVQLPGNRFALIDGSASSSEIEFGITITGVASSAPGGGGTTPPVEPPPSQEPAAPELQADLPATSIPSNAGALTLTANVSGYPVPTFQWEKSTNDGTTWAPVPGATSPTLTLTGLKYADNNTQYRVTATNENGTITSGVTTISGIPAELPRPNAPVVTAISKLAAPRNALQNVMDALRGISAPGYEIAEGSNISYRVDVRGDDLTYQWRRNGEDVAGATSSSWTAHEVAADDVLTVVVTNSEGGSVETSVETPNLVPGVEILKQPAEFSTFQEGGSTTLSVEAKGEGRVYYQWYRYNKDTYTSEAIPFAVLSTLTVTEPGTYYAIANNRANVPVTSDYAEVEETEAIPLEPPYFSIDLQDETTPANGRATLSVVADGNPEPTYQWQTRISEIAQWSNVSGATSASLELTGLTYTNEGAQYRVIATNSQGSVESGVTILVGLASSSATGQLNGVVRDALSNSGISGVNLVFYDENGTRLGETTTSSSGNYSRALPSGSIRIEISKSGYVATSLRANVVEDGTTEADAVLFAPAASGNGTISGRVINAFDASGVSGATLSLRSGINATTGTVLKTATTSSTGAYSFAVPSGNYTLETSVTGYAKTYVNVVSVGGNTIDNQNVNITPTLRTDEIRIVLTWGATPRDLDSHLTGPLASGNNFHMYYGSKSPTGSSAKLDVDDTTSYGPETTTISTLRSGTYSYYIHNFSGGTSGLRNSGAKVVVYGATGGITSKIAEYNVPTTADGLYWKVFTINGSTGAITTVNRITSAP
jgi:hypothetical protein